MNNLGVRSKEPMVYLEPSAMVLVVFFALGETVNHTRSGIKMLSRYRSQGKKTIYGPGLVTSWFILILLPFAISMRIKSTEYAFREKGYFEKFKD